MSAEKQTDTKARLNELRKKQANREAARAKAAADQELQELELLEKYEQELGPRGAEFELLSSKADGLFVIRRVEEVAYKKFKAAVDSGKASTEDYYDYVASGVVVPEREQFDEIVGKRPHLVVRLANAMLVLHGAKEATEAGKF